MNVHGYEACAPPFFIGTGSFVGGQPEWLGSKGSEGLHLQPTQLFVSWVNEVNTQTKTPN